MMKTNRFFMAVVVAFGLTACGGGNASKQSEQAEGEETEAAVEEKAETKAEEQKAQEPKKWWEQDFQMTYKMYIMGQSMTRTYARKGNVVACKSEGAQAVNVFVFTDSTRTNYLVNPDKGRYGKVGEKTGFSGIDAGVKKYMKDQLGDNFFSKILKKGDESVEAKDTTVFGRAAYVLTKEMTEKNIAGEAYGKTIQWVDKENGLIYYKYALIKSGDKVMTDGKVIEVTDFSATPTYEGLPMSLEGMEEVSK